MLPLQQAFEVKQSILEYLKATYSFKEKGTSESFYKFIEQEKNGMFKGPYISLKLPFKTSGTNATIPLNIKPNFPPYKHQFESFNRLSTQNNHKPQPTLLTTGTGSGKTEAFLYPILDYCHNNLNLPGIKVIILYPMNALATDQAKRLAEAIHKDSRLKGRLRAGLFIGEGRNKGKYPKKMGENNIIENRDEIISRPPDILLTNYKMLDYGLMRHQFHNLWRFNFENSQLLKFLILDELHTYDGAQGTDVANLIRRLKLKLNLTSGHICPIGTSATIGVDDASNNQLTEFATDIFGEEFTSESVITEQRLTAQEFFNDQDIHLEEYLPRLAGIEESRLGTNESYQDYINRQKKIWQIPAASSKYELAENLKKLKIVKDIFNICSNSIISLPKLIDDLSEINNSFKQVKDFDANLAFSPREEIITSLLALLAEAKSDADEKFPFVFVQVQFWIRELSGILRVISSQPEFTWRDKIPPEGSAAALPPYFCRECGASGWLAIKNDNRNSFEQDPIAVYNHYFENHKNVYFVNSYEEEHLCLDDYKPTTTHNEFLNATNFKFNEGKEADGVHIIAYRKLKKNKGEHICPSCNTQNSLNIIGARVSTLNSITTSQILSSDLDERHEQDRKILAFANSVQDAAHLSGFTEARNYRFTFRTSLQKVINNLDEVISLEELSEKFIEYWSDNSDTLQQNHKEAYFYRFFPSDYMGEAEVEDFRNPTSGKISKNFEEEFNTRISWEVISEFGYNGMIGRTLEKTGSSVVGFNSGLINLLYEKMSEWMNSNLMQTVKKEEFAKFVIGILHRIRLKGGIDHIHLSKYRALDQTIWSLNWKKDKQHFLNRRYHTKSRLPKFIYTKKTSKNTLDTTYTHSNNWFHTYLNKTFIEVGGSYTLYNEFFNLLFKELAVIELLNEVISKEGANYGINPKQLFVSKSINNYKCSTCTSKLHILDLDGLFEGGACLNYRCLGKYSSFQSDDLNYYNLVYNRSKSPRIYSSEHTGVLERSIRERIEKDYIDRPNFNSLNSLIASSTLEMGIHVGNLDTVINASIPPLPSNFLQRVGRAGRASGSALITNLSKAKAHDLFYFATPIEMMDGVINTPGCFLNAKEILYRHFTAFSIDSWTKISPGKHQIPRRIKDLNLPKAVLTNNNFFVNQLVDFVFNYQKNLFDRFTAVYDGRVNQEIFDEIKSLVREGNFRDRIFRVFEVLKNELLDTQKKEAGIVSYIKDKNLGSEDQERIELEKEKKSLSAFKRLIEKKSVLECLTNEGILPNYAFPESGVTLKAQVYGFKPNGGEREPERKDFEIVRSSSQALRELAPDNAFYSQGNRLKISGINTFEWGGQESTLSEKRFCSNCDFIEDNLKYKLREKSIGCPKCGDDSFFSESNIHDFALLKSVKSINSRKEAILDDSKDDRFNESFKLSSHFNFDNQPIIDAWGMKEIPFGIGFVKDVDITTINLGAPVLDSDYIKINQQDKIPRHGFVTCVHCGKSTSKPAEATNFEKSSFHYGYCRHKDTNYSKKATDIFKEVYLYRKVTTEVLKILLPVQEFQNESTQQMFKSGLELGLKKYYKGSPSHIGFNFYSEFNYASERFDRYLVLYDKVPGGTGYLQKLCDPKEFSELLRQSYKSIRDCSCAAEEKDGCYSCILSYSNQYIRSELSREKSENLFKNLVDSSNNWDKVNTGLSSLTNSGMIEESELERKFIFALKHYARNHPEKNIEFREVKDDGIQVYNITLPTSDGSVTYRIRPQVSLGERDGVKSSTRTDFYFTCTGLNKNGHSNNDIREKLSFRDVAVYLDGYTYHASKEHMRFPKDLKIREAIGKTPNIRHWSLSWSDVLLFEKEEGDDLFLDIKSYKETITAIDRLPSAKVANKSFHLCKNSIERLLLVLSMPVIHNHDLGYYFSLFQKKPGQNIIPEESLDKFHSTEEIYVFKEKIKPSALSYMFSEKSVTTELFRSKIMVRMNDLEASISLNINSLEVIDKKEWEEFLRIYNLLSLVSRYNSDFLEFPLLM